MVLAPSAIAATSTNTPKDNGNPASQANTISEEMKDKNRKDRVTNALNALERNISMVERAISKLNVKLESMDTSNKDYNLIKDSLGKASAMMTQSRAIINEAKSSVSEMNTTSQEDIKEMKDKILESKKLTLDSIVFIKKATAKLKTAGN